MNNSDSALIRYALCLILLVPFISFSSCDDDDPADTPAIDQGVDGFTCASTNDKSIDAVYDTIVSTLEANTAISIVAQVDHRSNAAGVGLELRPTRTIFFGNPALGSPIMQANPLAGLDLPQRITVFEEQDGDVVAGYNDTSYLADRYDVGTVATLPMISNALDNITSGAVDSDVELKDASDLDSAEGIIIKTSNNDFQTTYDNIIATLQGNTAITIVAELDHQANAASVNMDLDPIRVIIFGNPNLGTPLMQAEQTTALDLPQKMLVYTDADGSVKVAYNSPHYIATRHQIAGGLDLVIMIDNALDMISDSGVN